MIFPHNTRRFLKNFPCFLLCAGLACGAARAADYFWTNTAGGSFATAGNWVTGGLTSATTPGATDAAHFSNSAVYMVTWSADAVNSNAVFNNSSFDVTLGVGDSTWTVTNTFIVGQTPGATGTVTLSNGNLAVTNVPKAATLTVGQAGRGALVLNGATGAVNVVIVGGSSSNNALVVTNGALLSCSSNAFVGYNTGVADNSALVAGTGTAWRMAALSVGGKHDATAAGAASGGMLTIAAGGLVQNTNSFSASSLSASAVIGMGTGAYGAGGGANSNTVIVKDCGSTWSNSNYIVVGQGGYGNALIVSNGGTVLSAQGVVGQRAAATCNWVLITGPGSVWSNTAMLLGGGPNNSEAAVSGSVTVASGGRLATSGNSAIGYRGSADWNQVTVAGANSVWTNTGYISLGDAAGCNFNTLFIADTGAVYCGGALFVGNAGNYSNTLFVTNGGALFCSNFFVGINGSASNLVLADGAMLSTYGAAIGSNTSFNAVTLQNGSVWDLRGGRLTLGYGSVTGNTLAGYGSATITNIGGLFINDAGSIVYLTNGTLNGIKAGFSGGNLTVGSGGKLAPVGLVMSNTTINGLYGGYLGYDGSNNSILVAKGTLWNGGGQAFYVGYTGPNTTNNQFIIDGGGTPGGAIVTNFYLSSVGQVGYDGHHGDFNLVIVTNGGWFFTTNNTTIGSGYVNPSSASTNSIIVTGTGSLWQVVGGAPRLGATSYGIGNILRVENGGVLRVATAGNTIWLGQSGGCHSNKLIISGGQVYAAGGVSLGNNQLGQSVWVLGGPGLTSLLDCQGSALGMSANANTSEHMYFIDGAGYADSAVATNVTSVQAGTGGGYGSVIVTNKGRLHATGALTIGGGHFSSMAVEQGGKAVVGSAAFGIGNSNTLTVAGENSLLDLSGGNFAFISTVIGDVVTITEGGAIDNVGALTACTNNTLALLGGTLGITSTTYTNGLFTVGDGVQPATLKLLGGVSVFRLSALLNTNASLKGVGTLGIAPPGLLTTNGASFSAGASGPAKGLSLSNLLWCGQATNIVEVNNVCGFPGVGYDTINIISQLTLLPAGSTMAIRLDSLGIVATNFQADRDYNLRIMSYGELVGGFDPTAFSIDTNSFPGGGGTWTVTNVYNALYLVYRASPLGFTPDFVWNAPNNGPWSADGNWMGGVAPSAGGDGAYELEFGGTGDTPYFATNDQTNASGQFCLNKLLLSSTNCTATNTIAAGTLVFTNADARIINNAIGPFVITSRIQYAGPFEFAGFGLGSLTISNMLIGTGTVTMAGQSPVIWAQANAFTGDVVVSAGGGEGVLRVTTDSGLGTAPGTAIVVSNGILHCVPQYQFGKTGESNRRVLISGANSVWTNSGILYWGQNASANSNSYTVTDGGQLNVGSGFYFANAGNYNNLTISNGALVTWANVATLGGVSTMSNLVVVTGSNTLVRGNSGGQYTIAGTNNEFRIENGAVASNVAVKFSGVDGCWVVSNGARVFTGGSYGPNTLGMGFRGWVTGTNTYVNLGGSLYLGSGGTNGELRLENGAQMSGFGAYVGGYNGGNVSNYLIIDGATYSQTSSASAALEVGRQGHWNRMILTNGGRYAKTVALQTYVGDAGSNNTLEVYSGSEFVNGAQVLAVGYNNKSGENRLLVDGGAVNGQNDLQVGGGAGNYANSVVVTNGGTLTLDGANGLRIGVGTGSCTNWVHVSAGGVLNARGFPVRISPGTATWSNRFILDAGGWVTNIGTLYIGNPFATNNQLVIGGGTVMATNLMATNAFNTIAFAAGQLSMQNAAVSNGVPFVAGDGTQNAVLALRGGTNLFADGLVITNAAVLTGNGYIIGSTIICGTNSPAGAITNNGPFTLANGSVSRFDLFGQGSPGLDWDYEAVSNGTLTLAGDLKLVLEGGFTPTNSYSFVIMTNGGSAIAGSFANAANDTRLSVYSNDLLTVRGTIRVGISNNYVVLDGYLPLMAVPGTVYIFH